MRYTVACPQKFISQANQLASCWGMSEEDTHTYGKATWLDEEGNAYAVSSFIASDKLPLLIKTPLVSPKWKVDLVAAEEAKALLQEGPASPFYISYIVGDDVISSLSQLKVKNGDYSLSEESP